MRTGRRWSRREFVALRHGPGSRFLGTTPCTRDFPSASTRWAKTACGSLRRLKTTSRDESHEQRRISIQNIFAACRSSQLVFVSWSTDLVSHACAVRHDQVESRCSLPSNPHHITRIALSQTRPLHSSARHSNNACQTGMRPFAISSGCKEVHCTVLHHLHLNHKCA